MTATIQVNDSGKVYITSSGKVLLAQEGGSTLNIESLNVTPTTSSQTITASGNVAGYSPINVAAVTSSIDSNIVAGNIKKDVTILGVTGSYEGSGGGMGILREVKNGKYQMPTESFTFSLPNDATDVGNYCLYYAFTGCTGLTSLDLSSLTTVSGTYGLTCAFYGCTGLTSINLSSLTTISVYDGLKQAFTGCTGLTSLDLSSLTTVSGTQCLYQAFYGCRRLTSLDLSSLTTVSGNYGLSYTFYKCTGLTSVDLSSLTTISGNSGLSSAFSDCTALTSIDLPSLTTVSGSECLRNAFISCKSLTDVYFRALTTTSFGSYTNQFDNMMFGTSTTTTHTIHFPSNLESTISGLDGYPLFGGTDGYVVLAFDLPATE